MSCNPPRALCVPNCGVQRVTDRRREQASHQSTPLPKVTVVVVVLATQVEAPLATMEAS